MSIAVLTMKCGLRSIISRSVRPGHLMSRRSQQGILCLMLILDELVNVRVGLFAPQWNRAGHGYTIMLCVQPSRS